VIGRTIFNPTVIVWSVYSAKQTGYRSALTELRVYSAQYSCANCLLAFQVVSPQRLQVDGDAFDEHRVEPLGFNVRSSAHGFRQDTFLVDFFENCRSRR